MRSSQNTIGVWQLGEEEEAAKYGCVPGNFKIKDYNNDGKLTDDDYIIDGKRTPDWTGGMTNMFKIYDFDFSFHMYFQAKFLVMIFAVFNCNSNPLFLTEPTFEVTDE